MDRLSDKEFNQYFEVIDESLNNDKVSLEYFDLYVDDGEYSHTFGAFVYEADKEEVIGALCILTDKEEDEVEADFENLVDKYYNDLLDAFEEKAKDVALNNYIEDQADYDDHSGDDADAWHDTSWERESLNESSDDLEFTIHYPSLRIAVPNPDSEYGYQDRYMEINVPFDLELTGQEVKEAFYDLWKQIPELANLNDEEADAFLEDDKNVETLFRKYLNLLRNHLKRTAVIRAEDYAEHPHKFESLNEDSHTMQLYKSWINEPTFEEDKEDVIEDIKNNKCLSDGEKLELLAMISKKNEGLKLEEKISSELARALHLNYGRGHQRIDWEHSDIKQITKAEARREYENGNKENLIIAERDGEGDLRILAANGNRWGWRGSGSFRDALRDGTEFYLISNRVENPEKTRDRLIPGGDTGDHHPYNPWNNKNDERDWKAGRIDQFHSNHGIDPTGRHYVDSRNRYAASLADLQKHVDEYKELKQRLAWVKKESDWITAHQSNYKSADKLNKEKEKKMQKIKDEISYLQQELDRLEKAPLDTADNRLQVCNDKIAELTSQINTILKRPQSTAEGLSEKLSNDDEFELNDLLYDNIFSKFEKRNMPIGYDIEGNATDDETFIESIEYYLDKNNPSRSEIWIETDKFTGAKAYFSDYGITDDMSVEQISEIFNNLSFEDFYNQIDLYSQGMSSLKNESLNESNESSVPWILQQGEDGELEYLGFFKNRDDALDSYDPSFVYETTYINELDKDTYLAMRDEGEFNYAEQKELNTFFGINEEPTIDKYGNRYFIQDEFGNSVYRGAFGTVEKAKEVAERFNSPWKIVAYNYETDKWDILDQSEDKKNEEFKDYNPDDVPEDDTVDYKDTILRTNEDYYDDDEEEEEEGFDPVNPPVNLYDYLKENSNGAWISFSFDLGDGTNPWENYCHGIGDCRDPELLKQYEVIGERASGFSQSQGSHYALEVRKIGSNKKTTEHEDWTKELFDAIADGHGYSLKRNDIPAFIEKGKEFGYEWLYINNRLYLKGRDNYRLVSDAANGILNDLRLMANDINYSSYYRWNNKTKLNDIVEISNWGKWEDNKLSRNDQDILDKLINTQNNKFGVNITAEYPGNNKIILHLNNK